MTDDDNVLTLDSININPAFDFLSHYSAAIPADDDDDPANIISPYSNIDMCCKYFDETEFANEFKLKNEFLSFNELQCFKLNGNHTENDRYWQKK